MGNICYAGSVQRFNSFGGNTTLLPLQGAVGFTIFDILETNHKRQKFFGPVQQCMGKSNAKENKQGRTEDALALRGEEGRDKLRKATGIGTHELIRRYPNGATHYVEDIVHR